MISNSPASMTAACSEMVQYSRCQKELWRSDLVHGEGQQLWAVNNNYHIRFSLHNSHYDSQKQMCCDQANESEIAKTIFNIWPNKNDSFFCFLLFVQSFSCLYSLNQFPFNLYTWDFYQIKFQTIIPCNRNRYRK